MEKMLAVALGGAIGSVCRYGVSLALAGSPLATLIVNTVGCLLIGALLHESVAGHARLALLAHPGVTVGLLGGLTTFSTFGYQTVAYAEAGQWGACVMNMMGNVTLGVAAVTLGALLARHLVGGA